MCLNVVAIIIVLGGKVILIMALFPDIAVSSQLKATA